MKKKFNIIDGIILVIILAVIATGCVLYFKLTGSEQPSESQVNTVKLSFTVEVNNLSEDAADFLSSAEGQAVNFGKTSTGSGVISKVEIIPYKKITDDLVNGEKHITEVPGKYSARVIIISDVVKSDISYSSGDEVIAVGQLMPFNSNGVASEDSFIIDLAEVK